MKEMYAISLDDDIPLEKQDINNVKIICYLLFDEIKDLNPDVVIYDELYIDRAGNKAEIAENELLDDYYEDGNCYYHFLSEEDNNDYRKYNPFIINDNVFGFTVNDGIVNDKIICQIINDIQKLLKTNYHFSLKSYYYHTNDERYNIIEDIRKNQNETNLKKKMLSLMHM